MIAFQGKRTISEELWLELLDFVEDHVDVRDGDDGTPQPNRAMILYDRMQQEPKHG